MAVEYNVRNNQVKCRPHVWRALQQINPDVLYYTLQGEGCWDILKLLFAPPPLSFWGERRVPIAPPLEYFAVPQDPDSSDVDEADVEAGMASSDSSDASEEVASGGGSPTDGDAGF